MNETARGGVGFTGLLTLLFITLKLTDVITWSWFWVLFPSLLGFFLFIPLLVFVIIVAIKAS